MKNKKLLALILAIATVLSALALTLVFLIGCDGDDGDNGTPTLNPDIIPGEGDYVSKLPAKNWQGDKLRVIGTEDTNPNFTNFEVVSEGITGDIVGDAVYNRNELLKQKYGMEIEYKGVSSVQTTMQPFYDSQDDMYDLCLYQARYAASHAQNGYLLNLYNVPYLDFEHPTWNEEFNEELSIGGKLYFTTNDFMLQDKIRYSLVFYNRELARSNSYIEQDEYLEEKYVDNNNWTLAVFNSMVKDQGYDLDGGGPGGKGDHFGLAADDQHQFTAFCVGAGYSVSDNENGVITLKPADTNMVNIVTEVGKFGFDFNTVLYSHTLQPLAWDDAEKCFIAQNALFHSAMVSSFKSLTSKAQFEYGVLPYPKYDSSQTRYYTQFNQLNGSMLAMPYTIGDKDKAGYMVEALSEESHTTTYPIFIRDKVQLQDAYDEVSAKKLELVFESVYIEVATIYDPNSIFSCLANEVLGYKKASRFKAIYDRKFDGAEIKLGQIMDSFKTQG